MDISTQHCAKGKAKVSSFPFRCVGCILYILPNPSVTAYFYIIFFIIFNFFKSIFHYIWIKIVAHLVMHSGRVGPCQAKTSGLTLDPMWAGPGHEKSGLTLALPADSVCLWRWMPVHCSRSNRNWVWHKIFQHFKRNCSSSLEQSRLCACLLPWLISVVNI